MKKNLVKILCVAITPFMVSCGEDEVNVSLDIPSNYISDSYDANVVAESTVISELSTVTGTLNAAESDAQVNQVSSIAYPSTLSSVTVPEYGSLINGWLVELVNSANDDDAFQNPGSGVPANGEEGGLLGTRLLDEYGLELEQMIEKGSFGAALYNHALTVINGDLSDASVIDKLVEIHGTDASFDPATAGAAAKYSKRRSNQVTETGFFYDIKNSLITAKAAIEAGDAFNTERDQALADYLLAWEKSNFATVIYYCYATKVGMQKFGTSEDSEEFRGNVMHAYAEGVGFAHGFKRLSNKVISDSQIDSILELLLAPEGESPESYKFLNDPALISNLDQIILDIKNIYGFTDEEVQSFYVNDPT